MAYELLPDGSSFSPSVTLNFSTPQAPPGQTYVVRTFDHESGVWQEVPSVYEPETGVVTAHLSDFCFVALFARTDTLVPSAEATIIPTPTIVVAQPPPTAISTFTGMMIWIADLVTRNVMIVAGLIILAVALILYGRKRRRDRIMQ
jgi:LPXTG-motif cell wall-anchored protein